MTTATVNPTIATVDATAIVKGLALTNASTRACYRCNNMFFARARCV